MKLKNLNKILAFGILLNSISINSFAGVLSDDTRHETFLESNMTIPNILEEGKTNLKITGTTLYSVIDSLNKSLKIGKEFHLNSKYTYYPVRLRNSSYNDKLYVKVNFTVNHLSSASENIVVGTKLNGGWFYPFVKLKDVPIGVPVEASTIRAHDIESQAYLEIYAGMYAPLPSDVVEGETFCSFTFNNYVAYNLTELFGPGNEPSKEWCDANLDYLNEINSSFSDKLITQEMIDKGEEKAENLGKYKVELKSVNNNIENTIFSNSHKDESELKLTKNKEMVNNIYLNTPLLRGDTLEYINGRATHVHRSKKIILDGSDDEKWVQDRLAPLSYAIDLDNFNNTLVDLNDIISSKFNIILFELYNFNSVNGGINSGHEYITSFKNRIIVGNGQSSKNADEFKEWLRNNPIEIIYKLDTPIYEPIKGDLSVNLFEGTTSILNNSSIPTIMETTIDRTLNRAAEYVELAKTNPTVENLSKARYWNNLLKESIKKDQLQEAVNGIAKLTDMEIERETTTVNLDVYIKSENMLSLSLDTNSVTFDGYSGVEDIEMFNVVNLTISSSLPYKINAYLADEIQNSDKSNIIDKSMLNIKANSEQSYNRFNDTVSPIVLLDDQSKGNGVSHGIDLKLSSNLAHKADVYKTVIKFEAEQK